MRSDLFACFIWIKLHHLLDGRKSAIKHILVMLSKYTDSQLVVDESISVEVINLSDQSLNKSRLTSTVRSNKCNSRFHVNIDVDLFQKRDFFGPADRRLIKPHDWRRDFLRIRKHEDNSRILDDIINQVDPVDGFDSRLNKRRSLGIESELIDELLVVCDFGLLRLSLTFLLFVLFFFGLLVLVEVSLEVVQFLLGKLDDFVDNLVKEVTSMGNDQDCDVELRNILLKPN